MRAQTFYPPLKLVVLVDDIAALIEEGEQSSGRTGE